MMNDLQYALRQLTKNIGFSVVVSLTLALGIGATTMVFTIVKGVLLKPLDYPDSERIVHVWESDPEKGFKRRNTSPANFVDWRDQNSVFEEMAFSVEHSGMTTRSFIYTENGLALNLRGRFVTSGFFEVYGLRPIRGRSLLREEEERGAARVGVISYRLWHQLYGGDPEVVGRSITLENAGRHAYEIVGIMPEGFREPGVDVWIPCAHMPNPLTRRVGGHVHVVGRLKPGVTLEQAQVEMNTIQAGIHAAHGDLLPDDSPQAIGSKIEMTPLLESMVGSARPSLWVFSGAVALVLLIACANVANLLLSRNVSRRGEIAVRLSLGASRWRLIRQLLCESVILAMSGGVLGVILAHWGTRLMVNLNAGSIPRMEVIEIDGGVLLFALLTSLGTGVVFGLAPAWQSSKADLTESLKDGAARASASVSNQRLRSGFTVAQVALALMLLVGAGLLLRTFNELQGVENGFDSEELLTLELTMTGASYADIEDRRRFIRRLTDEMRLVPGVEAASAVTMIPDRGRGWPTRIARMDQPLPSPEQRPLVSVRVATPDYLRTYGIRLLAGREFARTDSADSTRVVMINKALADEIFPGEDPVGQWLHCNGPAEIIGVVANVRNSGLRGQTRREVYACFEQWVFQSAFLTVRVSSDPMGLAPVVSQHVQTLNPAQPIPEFRTMQAYLDRVTARPRFRSVLVGLFALTALLLASVGIYGVIAYSVAQRTREMGIRMALGAQRRDLMSLILKHGLRLTLIGVAVGLVGSLLLNRVLESLLFGVTAYDPTIFLLVATVLSSVALGACIIPALLAAKVDPMESFRAD